MDSVPFLYFYFVRHPCGGATADPIGLWRDSKIVKTTEYKPTFGLAASAPVGLRKSLVDHPAQKTTQGAIDCMTVHCR